MPVLVRTGWEVFCGNCGVWDLIARKDDARNLRDAEREFRARGWRIGRVENRCPDCPSVGEED